MPGITGSTDATVPGGFDGTAIPDGGMNMSAMGSADTLLQYIDDDPDSYSTIFENAKTDVTQADQQRLIQALKTLSTGDASAVDVDQVIRYFVVHNFVVNGDSYTGSMIHNYYLYEEDGVLSMIPWDYNLAFGTFQGGSAAEAVNDDIDAPLSVTGSGDRPMIDWILSDPEYTQLYHSCFAEFLQTVDIDAILDEAYTLIAPYVEKDPTKFCTYEEFETGVATLKAFCALRSQSVSAQLAGEEANVDASAITLSAMGTMNTGSAGQPGDVTVPGETVPDANNGELQTPQTDSDGTSAMPGGMQIPSGMQMPGNMDSLTGNMTPEAQPNSVAGAGGSQWLLLGVTLLILLAGLLFAFLYKR